MSDNPEKVSFHLNGPGIMTADKQFSIYVSKTLDYLGKNQNMIKYRIKMWREMQEHRNTRLQEILEFIRSGSKAEGLTSCFESDNDIMMVFSDVVCVDNVRPFIHNRHVFQTDRHDTHAGYTKLKRVNSSFNCSASSYINDQSIQLKNGDKYLSSDMFVSTIFKLLRGKYRGMNIHERSGPSLPVSGLDGFGHDDRVFAFRCICPSILQTFLTRSRCHNRPSRNELRDISEMDVHVVPVGHKRSIESHLEWRICFTKAELYLIQRLNQTENKLYIILKMVSKLLKFISKDITSYVMKNIVLWLVELYPGDLFTEDLLTYQLIQALRFLQKCVKVNFLPSYMIPERNLLADQLDPTQRHQLTTFLSTLIQERGYVLLRCEKLRNGMTLLYREPEMAENFRKRRDMTEKIFLLVTKITLTKMATTGLSIEEVIRLNENEGINKKVLVAASIVVCPDLIFLLHQRLGDGAFVEIVYKRRRQLLAV